jgi:dihydroorotase
VTGRILIKGAEIIDPSLPEAGAVDILIEGGVIKRIGAAGCEADEVIDAQGLCVSPGLVDMHVHLRDPGQTQKEDILTGCEAAAAGGVTSLLAMANTVPPIDTPEGVAYVTEKAKGAKAHVYTAAAVSVGQLGESPVDFEALAKAGAAAFSDDGHYVKSAGLMAEAMKRAAALLRPVISHCEEPDFVGGIMNEGEVSRALGVRGERAAAEELGAAREAALSLSLGLPVHVAHVSCAGTIAIIRDAKRRGVKITCETCPHYFSLDESELEARDADYRMNPPLRTRADVEAVAAGLADGTVDIIVTDHAPHTAEEKKDFLKAPNGVVGLETSLAAGITYLVRPGILTLRELIGKMSAAPAKLLRIPAGALREGACADLVVYDPHERWLVAPSLLHSRSHNTPYKGRYLYGKVRYTLCAGRVVYDGI